MSYNMTNYYSGQYLFLVPESNEDISRIGESKTIQTLLLRGMSFIRQLPQGHKICTHIICFLVEQRLGGRRERYHCNRIRRR